jgi:ribose transport system substrate-binding protein
MGLHTKIKFFGIDGLPHEGSMWVKNGILAATFLYPTPGEKGLEVAIDILNGQKKIDPGEQIILPTTTITHQNVENFIK